MTIVITILASDNSKNRYRARRAAKRERAMQDASLARRVANSTCSTRVTKAISLAGTRQKKVEVTAVKQNRIYYRDANPLGNKIHAVQRMKLSSKPLI
ncbi:hypothetical protein GG967_12315 [Salmonella enterica subsp. enterica]|nr:hypothetical protein [Salmonella enterica subsp. enterica serovar Chailey]